MQKCTNRLFIEEITDVYRGGGSGSLFFITVAARCGSGSFQKKKKIKKTRGFTQNFHCKERYTVKIDEFSLNESQT
jgi:hypothetical protein